MKIFSSLLVFAVLCTVNAKNVFVVEGAPDDVKKYATKIVKSNDEYGITEAIKEYILK